MKPLDPVLTVHLFPEERAALLKLLESLQKDDWARPTACAGWSVKDIAAHLLADDLGRLSGGRDAFLSFTPSGPERFEAELLAFINRQNELWVAAARRLSPRVLIDLLRWSGEQTQAYFESLNLFAMGEPVSWAGPDPAPLWLDIAREFTERWLHQSQVRDAVEAPPLTEPRIYVPVLDTFSRALPHTFRDTPAPEGTHVRLRLSGVPADSPIGAIAREPRELGFSLVREDERWRLYREVESPPDASVALDADSAWHLFTKGIGKAEAMARASVRGDDALAEKVFDTVSIIA